MPNGIDNGDLHINGITITLSYGGFKPDIGVGDAATLQAYDTLGLAYVTFGTLTSGNPPTFDLSPATTVGGLPIGTAITITGNSGGPQSPVLGNFGLVGSGGITVSGAAGNFTITDSGAGLSWNPVSTNQTGASGNGYIFTGGGNLTISLPAVSSVGDFLAITLDGSTSFQVTQGAGQSIKYGNQVTTTGGGGSLTSTAQGDSIMMVCSVANNRWNVISSMGNLTVI